MVIDATLLIVLPFIISFIIGIIAVKKFGFSDELFIESLFSTRDNVIMDETVLENIIKNIEKQEDMIPINPQTTRRSRIEIYIEVLGAIKNGIHKPTQIMYHINLSGKPLQRVLQSLVSQGMVKEESISHKHANRTTTRYYLTPKGENTIIYFSPAYLLHQ